MKQKIIIFTGKSGAGKDTAKEYVMRNYDVNFVVSSTTRPIRSNEKEGTDYNYITNSEFITAIYNNEFLEYRKYDTEFGVWYYGTPLKAFDITKSYVVIKDLYGAIELKKQLSEHFDVHIVYLNRPTSVRKYGAMLRDTNFSEEEWNRRLDKDELDFDMDMVTEYCTHRVSNAFDTEDLEVSLDFIMFEVGIEKRKEISNDT